MGTGIYKGGINHYRSISDNLPKVANSYHFAHGYFGERGDSTKERTRHIESSNPLKTSKDFYEKLTYGAIEKSLPNGKGKIAEYSIMAEPVIPGSRTTLIPVARAIYSIV